MKRRLFVLIMATLVIISTACSTKPEKLSKDSPSEVQSVDSSSFAELQEEESSTEVSGNFEFSDLENLEFIFSSGAGAWRTTVRIYPDGTFSGYYSDSDAGASGEGHLATLYESSFSGAFSPLVKVDNYEYRMTCKTLTVEGTIGEEKIDDTVKIVTTEPYGFDNADEFIIYLPNKLISELPESFLGWVHQAIDEEKTINFVGLYNVAGEYGFGSWEL